MAKLFANSGDPDQMLHSLASDLGLQCLPIKLSGVSRHGMHFLTVTQTQGPEQTSDATGYVEP